MRADATERRSDAATGGRGGRRAFTIVEMTIVIGIVVLLAGLTLAVSVSVVQASEVRQTEMTIRLLDAAIQEWEAQADRKVTYGRFDEPSGQGEVYEIRQPDLPLTPDDTAIVTGKLMAILMRSDSSRQILAQIDPEMAEPAKIDHDDDGSTDRVDTLIVKDAWGNAISAVLPGRTWVNTDFTNFSYLRNPDGTIQTPTELICGVATNRQVCFVSPGPDEKLGDVSQASDTDAFKAARDNLYSYEPAAPQFP